MEVAYKLLEKTGSKSILAVPMNDSPITLPSDYREAGRIEGLETSDFSEVKGENGSVYKVIPLTSHFMDRTSKGNVLRLGDVNLDRVVEGYLVISKNDMCPKNAMFIDTAMKDHWETSILYYQLSETNYTSKLKITRHVVQKENNDSNVLNNPHLLLIDENSLETLLLKK
ncbi:hypothetical protein GOV05_04490 [Candidatus Woesearchaeota archaeon]|nr:hypothetical protein [Candidatus Woesearchaeota archaeon]